MDKADFLLEIGTEELPPKFIKRLASQLATEVVDSCKQQKISVDGEVHYYATPRRLALLIKDLPVKRSGYELVRRGPAMQVAYDSTGKPTKACVGFARSCGVNVEDLKQESNEKGTWLICRQQIPPCPLTELLSGIVSEAVQRLSLPKVMKWGNKSIEFLRPVHWLVMLFDGKVVKASLFDILADNITYGHRFHSPEAQKIVKECDYEMVMQSKYVIPDFDKRRLKIENLIEQAAKKLDATCPIDTELLEETTGLVEYPVVLIGSFNERFLVLPEEILIITIQHHQKCFPLKGGDKRLLPKFVIVTHIESKNPDNVIIGNERVMAARLSDAEFFYQGDLKRSLSFYQESLSRVSFHEKLGSLKDKTHRLSKLMLDVVSAEEFKHDAQQAGLLAKVDQGNDIVREFPELQGIMGGYYVLKYGESKDVAVAIKEHYMPQSAHDILPELFWQL